MQTGTKKRRASSRKQVPARKTKSTSGVKLDLRRASDENVVSSAVAARKRAEASEAKVSSPSRWQEADSYCELHRRGWTQQKIAKACGVDQSTVSRAMGCVKRYAVPHKRPSFWHAYAEVTREAAARQTRRSRPRKRKEAPGRVEKLAERALSTIMNTDPGDLDDPGGFGDRLAREADRFQTFGKIDVDDLENDLRAGVEAVKS
jgi:hypothetical protein